MYQKIIIYLIILITGQFAYGQNCPELNLQLEASIPSTCSSITVTMLHDQTGKPWLYVAQKEGGLKIYDISRLKEPVLKKEIPVSEFQQLHVMNLTQEGNYLYLALGSHFGKGQNSGLAIIDVSSPEKASVTGFWINPPPNEGAGIVKVSGNYAYLGAMGHGLMIFDITDKNKPYLISQFVPDIHYPDAKADRKKFNLRGMAIRDNLVYACYDAGGIRIIDVTNKKHPTETGRYANPILNKRPRAYNNVVLKDSLLYVAVDYCGVEILNISNPSQIKQVSWWNPWNCQKSAAQWFSSEGHANEIAYDDKCKRLFISTGKSDMYILDIANPNSPKTICNYGGTDNKMGTWGVSVYQDKIFLSYICAFIPFSSKWTGLHIITFNNSCTK